MTAGTPSATDEIARFVAVGGSPWGGLDVDLRLAQPYTVLVGRNGAGKSALMRLIHEMATHATTWTAPVHDHDFHCVVDIGGRRVRYSARCRRKPKRADADGVQDTVWDEECTDISTTPPDRLWSTRAGQVDVGGAHHFVHPSTGMLSLDPAILGGTVGPVARALRALFGGAVLVDAGLPRTQLAQSPIYLALDRSNGELGIEVLAANGPRSQFIAATLAAWHERDLESFRHVERVLLRLGISRRLELVVHTPPTDPRAFGELRVDGLNLGLASDGTLRVIEMVVALQRAAAGSVVMIEEPETGIHPGLLDRILAEFEALADDIQVIISTHSPEVVDRVEPNQLRHVWRDDAGIHVDELSDRQVEELKVFLSAQGTLGEYVFTDEFEDDVGAAPALEAGE